MLHSVLCWIFHTTCMVWYVQDVRLGLSKVILSFVSWSAISTHEVPICALSFYIVIL